MRVIDGFYMNSKLNTSIFNFNPSSPGEMEDFKGASFYAYDIIRLVAQQGFEMSDTGELPKTLAGAIWEGLTGLVAGVADVLYQGLVAIGNFFASLGDAVASWGQKLLGAINTATDAVKAAVQAVLDVLMTIVKWIIEKITLILDELFAPLRTALSDASNELNEILSAGYMHYLNDGMFGASESSALMDWIIFRILVPATIGAVIISGLIYLFSPFATLAALIALGVVGILLSVWAAGRELSPPPNWNLNVISPFKTLEDNINDLLGTIHTSRGRGSRQVTPSQWTLLVVSTLSSLFGSAGLYLISKELGPLAGFSLMITIILFFISLVPPNAVEPAEQQRWYQTIFVLNVMGLILNVGDIIGGWKMHPAAVIIGLIGLLFAVVGTIETGTEAGYW